MLIKFGSEENIKKLLDEGLIFMNSKERFRKIEDQQLRGDSYEGASSIKNIGKGKFRIQGADRDFNFESMHLPTFWSEVYGNIYSMTCITPQTVPLPYEEFKMDERYRDFGTHCVFIPDANGFIKLMVEKFKFLNYKAHIGFVEYYDLKKYNGDISPFQKPNEFGWQKEFRFYVERNGFDPLQFRLGSLHGIAHLETTEIMLTTLKLVPENNSSLEPQIIL